MLKNFIFGMISVIFILFQTGCKTNEKDNLTIGDIAYDSNKRYGYTVYIKENEKYVPYLVLSNNYNRNTLLLRKNTLEELQPFNDYSSYYLESSILKYLNNTFYETITKDVKEKIVLSEYEITSKSALGEHGKKTEKIENNIFLLSFEELNFGSKNINIVATEGTVLKYFEQVENRLAYDEEENVTAWWLRSPDTGYYSCSFLVSSDGKVGSVNTYNENGVRPAFCIPNNTNIEKSNNIIDGQEIYVIAEQN